MAGRPTKDKSFAANFFTKYVNGHESFDYAPLLQKAGLTLKKQFAGKAWLGDYRYEEGTSLKIASNTIIGTPLYVAGLDIDDQIVKVDGKTVGKKADLDAILASHKPGDTLDIEFKHREETKITSISLMENPRFMVQTFESSGIAVSDDVVKFRKSWLDSKVVK